MGTPDGSLYYRVFGRGEQGLGEVRSIGPLRKNQEVLAFGGNPNQPMTISFRVEDYLQAGREKEICEPMQLPKSQMNNSLGAALVDMTVDGHTEEFWIRRSPTLEPLFQRVSFPSGDYEVAFDVDRKDLGFSLKLDDFDVGFDPGTEQASRFVSQVRLNDESRGINEQPHTISMNEPLTHRGYTFYQSSYNRHRDPQTLRETGQFQSVFQVATDPGRSIKYAGCLLVVLGAFVQFYMRAGLFSDGGKREREWAAAKAKAKKRAEDNGQEPGSTVTVVSEADETL
jgi:cytochrome c biogenesis protein ResB